MEKLRFYIQETTGIRYEIGDLFGYPDSLIRSRVGAAYEFGLPLLKVQSGTVLDFGSGRGHGIKAIQEYLSPNTIVSIDKYFPYLQNQQVSLTNHLGETTPMFINGSTSIPFPPNTFDAVTCMHVIEHIKDPQQLLQEFYRTMKLDGKLLLATPDKRNLVGKSIYDEKIYFLDEFAKLLKENGFKSDFYYLIPNDKARLIHDRKKWLASNLPFTGAIRNYANPKIWDAVVLRSGISLKPLVPHDFRLSQQNNSSTIDLLAVASKQSN